MDAAVAKVVEKAMGVRPLTLPEGWCWATLEDVADGPQYGWTASAAATGRVRLLRTTDISSGKVDWATVPFCSENPADVDKYVLREGDIVISRAGSVGKSFLISKPLRAVFASYLIRFQPRMDGKYMHYFLQTRSYWAQIGERSAGIAIPNVNGSKLKSVRLPLAPLAEQHRIVARVDALFAEIAEGEAALAAARKGLDTFRRALLKAAVTGELTKDWRAANPVTETGHDILARIVKDRAHKGAPKARARRAADARLLDTSVLPQIPEGWTWATIRELADVIGGLTKNPDRERMPVRIPYLRVANVQAGSLDLSEMKEIGVTKEDRQRASLEVSDLLIVEGNGSIDQIGRCAIWNGEIAECVHQNHIIKVRFSDSCLSQWCFTWLLSPHGREEIEQVAASTSGLHTLSISKVEALPIPIPPPAEAAEILRRVSDALSAAADTLAMLDAEAADAARLKQSILKAAFEGRLVPQDSADEPANTLLTRMAADPVAPRPRRERARKSDA